MFMQQKYLDKCITVQKLPSNIISFFLPLMRIFGICTTKIGQNLEKQHKIEKKDHEKENPSYNAFTLVIAEALLE